MTNAWFSNNGQKIQLAVAVLGVVLTGINAWPAISSLHLLNIASLIFYIVVLIAAFSVARLAAPHFVVAPQGENKNLNTVGPGFFDRSKLLPEPAKSYEVQVSSIKIVLAKGHDWSSGGDPLRKLRVVYHDLVKEGDDSYRADIEFFSISDFVGGSLTKSLKQKGSDRFLLPVSRSEHSSERNCIYNFMFTDDTVRFDFVRLSHINKHSGEIQLMICRGQGHKQK
jgi:hypothetical protein